MEFKDIIAVPGMSGLYKIVGSNKNGFIVESLADQKRSMINSQQRIMTLTDIAVFTNSDDKPLYEVFQILHGQNGGNPGIDLKAEPVAMREFFKTIVPDFNEEKVYNSDIKKMLTWYETLKDKIDFSKPLEEDEEVKGNSGESERPVHHHHEGHGPREQHAKTTSAKTRKKV
ncbi:MAG: DUF5606 domain-containing protein [Bacteroidia bacterium]|nr:DUF5606 domain-containing protein [Bacteroidia bacterium]